MLGDGSKVSSSGESRHQVDNSKRTWSSGLCRAVCSKYSTSYVILLLCYSVSTRVLYSWAFYYLLPLEYLHVQKSLPLLLSGPFY